MLVEKSTSVTTSGVPDFGRRTRHQSKIAAPKLFKLQPRRQITDWKWATSVASSVGNFDKVMGEWIKRRRKAYPHLVDEMRRVFENSRQTVLYRLTVAEVRFVARTTEHALGDISKTVCEDPKAKYVADCTPAYPVILLLHELMEALGRVPTWQDFKRYLFENQHMCLGFFIERGKLPPPQSIETMWGGPVMEAIRWRLGNFYYSFLREVHLITVLREVHGLDALYHPLLDAEWKADCICGPVRVELYFNNIKFKTETSGRKSPCQKLNPDSPVLPFFIKETRTFGSCWLFKDADIAILAHKIRALGGTSIPSFNRGE